MKGGAPLKRARVIFQNGLENGGHKVPGVRLSTTEKGLLARWSNPKSYATPFLRKLVIGGRAGFRGLQRQTLEYKYPVTVLCGKNGSGKSTLLAASLLAFHSSKADLPPHLQARRLKRPHYTFGDFFYQGPNDPSLEDAYVEWTYTNGSQLKAIKKQKRWLVYDRRKHRAAIYLGASRIVPAFERTALRSHFKPRFSYTSRNRRALNGAFVDAYSEILGRTYSSVGLLSSSKYQIAVMESDARYSAYNSGIGEDALTTILYEIQECPRESFIAIEEIELGLHPQAQIRLANFLQRLALEKGLQIVVTSHSDSFIDALPRDARVLIQRAGKNRHIITYAPSTRFAMSDLSGLNAEELIIYCEDVFAATLITQALPHDLRKRVFVAAVSGDSKLAEQAAAHIKSRIKQKILLIWDGDVTKSPAKAKKWIRKSAANVEIYETAVNWTFLPGTKPPEEWAVTKLMDQRAQEKLAAEFDVDCLTASTLCDALRALNDPKEAILMLKRDHTQNDESVAMRGLARAAIAAEPVATKKLVDQVRGVLDGESVTRRFTFDEAVAGAD